MSRGILALGVFIALSGIGAPLAEASTGCYLKLGNVCRRGIVTKKQADPALCVAGNESDLVYYANLAECRKGSNSAGATGNESDAREIEMAKSACYYQVTEADGSKSECRSGVKDAANPALCTADETVVTRFFADPDCRKDVRPKACFGLTENDNPEKIACDTANIGAIVETKGMPLCRFASGKTTTNFYYDNRCFDAQLISAKRGGKTSGGTDGTRTPAGKTKKNQ